jgi:hypothetical protein
MRTLVLLFLAACGESATNPCAASIALPWGTSSDIGLTTRGGRGGAGRLKRRPHGIRVRAFGGPRA